MAKRKRLSAFGIAAGDEATLAPLPVAPVARIAAEAATQAALDDLAAELRSARDTGRMIMDLPLSSIEATHLQRDRMYMDAEEMAALKASIRNRGQQMPIEVISLADRRYGLISGARRLTALRALHGETGEKRFATVKALLRPFDTAPEAYLAMVEENEIRTDLSFYERGRLAHEAARLGVFDSPAAAVKMLFQHAPAPKRSKILSFVALHDALSEVLRFPEGISEKLGLAIVKAIGENPELVQQIQDCLQAADPEDALSERMVLEAILQEKPSRTRKSPPRQHPSDMGAGVLMKARPGKIELTGQGVTEDFLQELANWLQLRR